MAEQTPRDTTGKSRWRIPLLVAEFGGLAVLVGSMSLLGSSAREGESVDQAWLLVPALASLVVFLSFLGLMYLRWINETGGGATRQRITFALLAVTLLGVWAFGIARTWQSIGQ
ncbi:MAG: hypothetical protein R3280_01195 [Marinobacter sp.]|uniref:hypothetical protein n=1 Tax=Marinobacter sp. TaxID=50741 RepID=UPI00299D3E7B|nr:hypothetical protein [Marinobacter sp.]MDX1633229.1 hypothetical protein [Marinobacter sp.]